MSPDSENISPLLQEYFDNHYDRHLAELHRRNSVSGRMEEAFEKNKKRLAFFDTGDIRVILSSLRYNKDTKKVDDVNIDFILIK